LEKELTAEEKLMKELDELRKHAEDAMLRDAQMNATMTLLVPALISRKEV